MLCEDCPALRCEGYEYPEEYCLIQKEEHIQEFKNGSGCFLRRKTIQKRVKKAEEEEGRYYDGLAKAYALDCLEKKKDVLSEYINAIKECLGLFDYNCPSFTKKGQKKMSNLIRNKKVVCRVDAHYKQYRELELCGLIESDKKEEHNPFKKPDMEESITFWVTKEGFCWLSKKETHESNFIEYRHLQGPVAYLSVEDKKQAEAYAKKAKIKVGDQFMWKRSELRKAEYITSGRLRHSYMYSPDFPYTEQGVLEVYNVYEGENGYGPFVDYYLKAVDKSAENYHIIINGVDAMKMKKIKKKSTE